MTASDSNGSSTTTAIVVATIVVAVTSLASYLKPTPSSGWLEGDGWKAFLELYDKYAKDAFYDNPNCKVKDLESRFGSTRVYLCGDPGHTPVMLLHSNQESAIMYGDWMVPKLVDRNFFVIAVDALGDTNRSKPKDGLTSSLPHGPQETTEWFLDVKAQVGLLGKPVSLMGHSHGSFLSSVFTKYAPSGEIDRVALTSPAATFGTLAPPEALSVTVWSTFRFCLYAMAKLFPSMRTSLLVGLGKMVTGDANVKKDYENKIPKWDLRRASFFALESQLESAPFAPQVIAGPPWAWTVEELKGMRAEHKMMLFVGDLDKAAVDANQNVELATKAGIPSKMYRGAGHCLPYEWPREELAADVIRFLEDQKVEGATYP